ncbi:helix-turn-helix transcriptional regulator [Serratia marcescens]|nr:LuxR C-terminal-related transcriptional regulator [Serratia marcescens]ELA7784350.1 response regulator transcription factor [Serratia marcescens]KFD14550.1 LuxR family transcriptional regulator [Serratia marcescens subsp. marcescens ATCC 13880]KFL02221.1 bacterial regulatory s, luxR family protein [Serratia marcescens]MBN5344508.1 response regulator transcription factor [Serratia marcescens]MCC3250193.1 LuxR C-terminal-related transcriptional regulator [Serratia marcescens]
MRKVAIFSQCNFILQGMSCIARERESLSFLLMTHHHLTPHSAFTRHVELDDLFVHVQSGRVGELRLIQKLIMLSSPPRVIVMVDNAHVPTLKLLRAMGVIFIISLRDALSNIGNILQDSSRVNYMSVELHAVIKAIPSAPAWATERGAFDEVQYLTPMETEITLDLLQGLSPRQVAIKRFISVKTVSTHKLNALKKMELGGINEFFITHRR